MTGTRLARVVIVTNMCAELSMRRFVAACLTVCIAGCEVSQDQEVQIGEQNAQEISAHIPVVQDPYITSYVNELGDTIASHTSRNDLDWHFFVV
ncbi:MAG: hypothetical protein ABI681_08325, partial [Gemmatimonadales bacterium]